jgi:DNA-binding HxlR family transcriptional regulator
MLAQTLRELERDGLVLRTRLPLVPPHVMYSLTPLGRECAELVAELACWLQSKAAELEAAQRRYDADSRDREYTGGHEAIACRAAPHSTSVDAAA